MKMLEKERNFLIAGVGGQGTVLASDIIGEAAIRQGLDAKKSDILGLAVRGGSVVSHVRWGEKVDAPVLDHGDADFLIGFEWVETFRQLSYLKPGGQVIVNQCRIDPMTVSTGKAQYPSEEKMLKAFSQAAGQVHVVPGLETALDLGNSRTLNIVLLGALCKVLGQDLELWQEVVKDRVPAKFVELNLEAIQRGFNLID
jgi:indolepyruvate ferredoxin oxidoreductase beta subunit